MEPSAGLDTEAETEICALRWESNLDSPVIQLVPQSRFTTILSYAVSNVC